MAWIKNLIFDIYFLMLQLLIIAYLASPMGVVAAMSINSRVGCA